MRSTLLAALAVVTLLTLAACQVQTPPITQPPPPIPIDQEVSFENYTVYIENQAEAPGISFDGFEKWAMQGDQYTLVAALRGQSPSTGYAIRIDRILTDGQGRYLVHVTLLDPELGVPQSDVLTYPTDTVLIDGYNKDATFEMVVDATLTGPYDPEEVTFEDFRDDWIEEGQLAPEGGLLFFPLAMQTSGVDTALAAYRTLCPTTGYGITIARVTKTYDGLITVYARLTDPAPGSVQAQVITQPLHAIRIQGNSRDWGYTLVIID